MCRLSLTIQNRRNELYEETCTISKFKTYVFWREPRAVIIFEKLRKVCTHTGISRKQDPLVIRPWSYRCEHFTLFDHGLKFGTRILRNIDPPEYKTMV